MNINQRFFDKVSKTDSCWNWIGVKNNKGYGRFWANGKFIMAHHFLVSDAKPAGAWVLHKCDNPACVRPDHLFFGDAKANSRDMHSKGRGNPMPGNRAMLALHLQPKGEAHYCAKLTNENIKEIKATPKRHGYMSELARKFNVSHQTIRFVVNGITWKQL